MLLRWLGTNEFDEIAVGITHDGQRQGWIKVVRKGDRSFGDGLDTGLGEACEGSIGAFDRNSDVAKAELGIDDSLDFMA